jgi:hypothetical protein
MGSWDPKHPSNLKMKLIPTLKAYLNDRNLLKVLQYPLKEYLDKNTKILNY